jgi:hypothetical protein
VADALATQGEDAASSSATATASPEIEKLKAEYEERFKGMQRLISERERTLADLQRKQSDLELASLPDGERAIAMSRRADEELARLRAENELLKLRNEYPNEVPAFEKLLKATTPKDQLDILRELARGMAASDKAPEPPDVDPNNPMRTPSEGAFGEMTDELADRILKAAPKGALFKIRGR